jgi:hypothetical protein
MSAVAQLGLDASGFMSSIASSQAALQNFKSVADNVSNSDALPEGKTKAATAAIIVAVTACAVILAKGTQAAIQFGAGLVDASYNVGLAASQTMALQLAVQRYGLSADSVIPATQKFNTALQDAANGTGPLVGVLQNAGISMDSLASMDVATRMQTVAAAIKGIQHPTEQAAAATAVWGAEGIKLNEALQPGKINSASAALGSQAALMEQNAGIFARISQIMAQSGSMLAEIVAGAKAKIQGFFIGLASELAPEILSILDSISSGSTSISDAIKQFAPALAPMVDIVNTLLNMDFAAIGQSLGKSISIVLETVRGFKFSDIFTGNLPSVEGLTEKLKAAFEESKVKVEETKKLALETFKTPEANVPALNVPAPVIPTEIQAIGASLSKIGGGGNIFGGGIGGGDPALSIAREQLSVQEEMKRGILQLTNYLMQPMSLISQNPAVAQ